MRVAIAGGGTGGHFFPALTVLRELRRRGFDVLYVGAKGGIEYRFRDELGNCLFLDVKGIRGKGLPEKLKNAALMSGAVLKTLSAVSRFNPERVAVFGGYASLPLGICAVLLRKRLIIHEQNSIPGKTNLFLSRFSGKVLIGNRYAERFFKSSTFTGNPVRSGFEVPVDRGSALRRFGLSEGRFTVLVVGGSQGSRRLNGVFIDALSRLREADIQVIHVSGRDDFEMVREAYRRMGIRAFVSPFIEDLWNAYAVSDVAVSRSGAMSVAELCRFGVPAIFIPYPYAVDDHQFFNVKPIYDSGGCFILREEELSPERVSEIILNLKRDEALRKKLSAIMRGFSVDDSLKMIVEEIVGG